MITLDNLRSSNFEPYLPFRWDVKFLLPKSLNNIKLNIIKTKYKLEFPATSVTWSEGQIITKDIPFGPHGQSITLSVGRNIPKTISILFYENNTKDITASIKNILSLYYTTPVNGINLNSDKGGLEDYRGTPGVGFSDPFKIIIQEYDNSLKPINSGWQYSVQFDGSSSQSLVQDSVAAPLVLNLNIIGIDREP